jgi:phosphoenolpyruvate carboxykinase (ATP)
VEFETMPVFNLTMPKSLAGVETDVLNPRNAWSDKAAFDNMSQKLAGMFVENFKKYTTTTSEFDFTLAGPIL